MVMSSWVPQIEDISLAVKYPSLSKSTNFSKEMINDVTLSTVGEWFPGPGGFSQAHSTQFVLHDEKQTLIRRAVMSGRDVMCMIRQH